MFLRKRLDGGGSAKAFMRLVCELCLGEISIKNCNGEKVSAKKLLEITRFHYPSVRGLEKDICYVQKYLETNRLTLRLTCRSVFQIYIPSGFQRQDF